MNDALVILMPTFDRYRWLADLTERCMDRWWEGHPTIYRCGCSEVRGARDLPLRNDPRDWMGIALSAARDLAGLGVRHVYLVLDDIPPIGPCHAAHLNATLPRWAEELQAGCIGLNGWGQGRLPGGREFDAARLGLQRVDPDFAWRFPLHPTLWRVQALVEILDVLTRTDDLKRRSAWAFERRAGDTLDTPAARWSERCYRVCGARMVSPAYRLRRPVELWLRRRAGGGAHAWHTALRRRVAADRVADRTLWLYRDYRGPYPLFHSGIMAAGQLNRRFLRFVEQFGSPELLAEVRASARAAGHRVEAA